VPLTAAIGYCWSDSSFMKVDFPAPFGPRIAVCSPAEIVSVRRSRTRAPPRTTVASQSSSSGWSATPLFGARPRSQIAVEIEDRRRVVLQEAEFRDDLA